jgi:hypothetical protein
MGRQTREKKSTMSRCEPFQPAKKEREKTMLVFDDCTLPVKRQTWIDGSLVVMHVWLTSEKGSLCEQSEWAI